MNDIFVRLFAGFGSFVLFTHPSFSRTAQFIRRYWTFYGGQVARLRLHFGAFYGLKKGDN